MKFAKVEKFADETSIHGIPDWYRAGVLGKVGWGIMILGCLMFFVVSIYGLVSGFLAQESISSVDLVEIEFPTFGFYFPATRSGTDSIDILNEVAFGPDFGLRKEKMTAKQATELLNLRFLPVKDVLKDEYMSQKFQFWRIYRDGFVVYAITVNSSSPGRIYNMNTGWNSHYCPTQGYARLYVGSRASSWRSGQDQLARLRCNSSYDLRIGVKKFTREKQFCNAELGGKFPISCEHACQARYWRKRGCGPFVHSLAENLMIGSCGDTDNKEVREKEMDHLDGTCKKACSSLRSQTPCEEVKVTLLQMSSFESYNSQGRPGHLKIDFDDHEKMLLYHTSLKVTPMMLIANVGGTLGLCIGASLLSLVHAIYSLVTCVRCQRKAGVVDVKA